MMMKRIPFHRMLAILCALATLLCAIPALTFPASGATVLQNVALGKSVTSPQGAKNGVTNGSVTDTLAYSQDPWEAVSDSSKCWVEIDLGGAYAIEQIKVVNWYGDNRYYYWEAYASGDNTLPIASWTKIAEKKDSVVSTSSGTTKTFPSLSARYVRVFGVRNSANTGFHFAEIEVYAQVAFETQTWTVGTLTAVLDADAVLTFSGSGAIPDYASTSSRPWNAYASVIRAVVAEEGVTAFGKNAFADFGSLESVTVPSTMTALKENAFSGSTPGTVAYPGTGSDLISGLTVNASGNDGFWRARFVNDPSPDTSGYINGSINWSVQSGVLTLSGSGAIPDLTSSNRPWRNYDDQITEIRIGNGISSIGRTVFSYMSKLETVFVPDTVTTLWNDAFAYCGSIDYLRLSCNLTSIYQGVLYGTSVTTIACAINWESMKSQLTVLGSYNENFASAAWVSEDDSDRLFNLSKGRVPEVTAGTGASFITDGSKSGSFWDGGVAPAEVTIDLGSGAYISSINVVTYYGDGRYYHYEIYVSTDGRNYVFACEKNDSVKALASGEDYAFAEPLYARYVRVVMTYNSANASVHLREVTVMGRPDPAYVEPEPVDGDIDDPQNVAYGKPVRSALSDDRASRVTDGSAGTYWSAVYFPSYVDVDLMQEYALTDIVVYMPVRSGRYYYYTVYGSNDLSTFTRIYQKRTNELATPEGDVIDAQGCTYRFLRIYVEYVSGAGSAYLAEVRVHGAPLGSNTASLRTGSIDEILGIEDFDSTEYAAPLSESETIENVYGIIDRTVGAQYRSWFTFSIVPVTGRQNDYYTIENQNGKIHITAGDGVCLAAGLNYYYKYYCNVEISEQARQTKMPESVVPVSGTIRRETPYKIRYAFNYCTLDYSFAFFGKEDFVRENDWLALCGVNVVLDLAGQEAVWIKFLMNFGYTFDEAKDWIAGPSYYAWQFMDNLENFGGPVPDGWIADRLRMARENQRFKRSLGIQTVLQGYAGMIPTNFAQYQDVEILKQGGWCGLSRPDMIRTDGTLYDEYAALFYEAQRWALGETTNYYAADPFHEGGIRPSDLSDETIAQQVLESLLRYDPDAVWMVQAWWSNPTNGLLQGMGDNRQDHVIILDLTADKWNTLTYGSTTLDEKEFDGTDWVWCLLKNYGGNPSMDGRLSNLVSAIPAAYASSQHMKGIGLISEATLDNPVVYQLLFDMAWETSAIDLDDWLDHYVVRRYGAVSESAREAWTILKNTVYSRQGNSTQITARMPDNVGKTYSSNNEAQLEKALKLLLTDYALLWQSPGYRYDLSELMRQMVNNYANTVHTELYTAFEAGDLETFRDAKERFLAVFDVLDLVLGTEKDLLAGTWIGRAEDWAAKYDDFAMDCLPMNAKALITTWAGAASCNAIPDYAYRHYQGMMIDVYKARWEIYLDKQEAYLESGEEIVKMTQSDYFHFYWNWVMNTPAYARTPDDSQAHLYAVAQRVLNECSVNGNDTTNVGNVARDKDASASAETDSPGSFGGYAGNAVDGSTDTYWDGGSCADAPELIVDLGALYDLERINVVNYVDGSRYYLYEIYVSTDGVHYEKLLEKSAVTAATLKGDDFAVSTTCRYIKLIGLYNSANDAFHVSELRAYGNLSEVAPVPGDLDGDGTVTITDVTVLLNRIAGLSVPLQDVNFDIDGDHEVNVLDVTALLNLIAGV